nr:replication protein A 70 kDa DNA-binding subunit B [Tanacetum cinerariifolium]
DETGTMSLTLWNDEVQDVVDRLAYQLCDKYVQMDSEATSSAFPTITPLVIRSYDVDKEESSDGKNKRPAENDISNEFSNGKNKAIEVKTEKDTWLFQ